LTGKRSKHKKSRTRQVTPHVSTGKTNPDRPAPHGQSVLRDSPGRYSVPAEPEGLEFISPGQRPGIRRPCCARSPERQRCEAFSCRKRPQQMAVGEVVRLRGHPNVPRFPRIRPPRCFTALPFRAWLPGPAHSPGRCPGLADCGLSGRGKNAIPDTRVIPRTRITPGTRAVNGRSAAGDSPGRCTAWRSAPLAAASRRRPGSPDGDLRPADGFA